MLARFMSSSSVRSLKLPATARLSVCQRLMSLMILWQVSRGKGFLLGRQSPELRLLRRGSSWSRPMRLTHAFMDATSDASQLHLQQNKS